MFNACLEGLDDRGGWRFVTRMKHLGTVAVGRETAAVYKKKQLEKGKALLHPKQTMITYEAAVGGRECWAEGMVQPLPLGSCKGRQGGSAQVPWAERGLLLCQARHVQQDTPGKGDKAEHKTSQNLRVLTSPEYKMIIVPQC